MKQLLSKTWWKEVAQLLFGFFLPVFIAIALPLQVVTIAIWGGLDKALRYYPAPVWSLWSLSVVYIVWVVSVLRKGKP